MSQPDPTKYPQLALLRRFSAQAEFTKLPPIIIDILEVIVVDLSALQQDVQYLQAAGAAAASELGTLTAQIAALQAAGPGNITQADIDNLATAVGSVTNALSSATTSAENPPTPAPAPAPTPAPTPTPSPSPAPAPPVPEPTPAPAPAPAPEPAPSPESAPEPPAGDQVQTPAPEAAPSVGEPEMPQREVGGYPAPGGNPGQISPGG